MFDQFFHSSETSNINFKDRYICSVKYKYDLSATERLADQYNGFIKTIAPPFWNDKQIELFPFPALGQPISHLSVPPNTVLGKRAEVFFAAMILNSSSFRLKTSQIQLIKNGITQGEIDFIVENSASHELIHIELSYKFYLLDSKNSNALAKWVGPNRRDSLERKWQKLIDLQFPKIYSAEGINILKQLGNEKNKIHQALCMPMQLFIPFGESKRAMGVLSMCYAGRWISFVDFVSENWIDYTFFIPEKEDWFVNPENCEIWMTETEIVPALKEKIERLRSPMLWMKLKSNIPVRLFVTFW